MGYHGEGVRFVVDLFARTRYINRYSFKRRRGRIVVYKF